MHTYGTIYDRYCMTITVKPEKLQSTGVGAHEDKGQRERPTRWDAVTYTTFYRAPHTCAQM